MTRKAVEMGRRIRWDLSPQADKKRHEDVLLADKVIMQGIAASQKVRTMKLRTKSLQEKEGVQEQVALEEVRKVKEAKKLEETREVKVQEFKGQKETMKCQDQRSQRYRRCMKSISFKDLRKSRKG